MKLFINGDPSFSYVNEQIYDAAMVIRFGSDSSNFYEYRAPIHPDVRPGQPWNSLNEVTIVFSDLTSLKLVRDSVNQVVDMPVPNGPPGAIYRVKGNPSLSAIREFALGVEKNKTGLNAAITGSVWFNELRVLKIDDNNGYAMNVNTGVKVADVGEINFNYNKVDPNFHALDQRVGSRVTGENWDVNFIFNIHKLINNALASLLSDDWKDFLNFPLSFRHTENIINPRYFPGTDIDLDKAALARYNQVLLQTRDPVLAQRASDDIKLQAQGLMVRNEFSVNGFGFKFPGSNYFINTVANKFTVNFNGSVGHQRDFTYSSKSDFNYTGSLNYKTDFGLADILHLNIGKIINLGEEYKDAKLYFFLPFIPLTPLFSSDFNASIDFSRTRMEGKQRLLNFDDAVARQFGANRGFSFNWKFLENWIVDLGGNYNFKATSDLAPFETFGDSLNTLRPESQVFKQIFFNNALINFGKDLNYQQTNSIVPKFNIPIIKKFLDLTTNYSVTYAWSNPNTTTNIGSNVGFSNNIQAQVNFKLNELLGIFSGGKGPSKFKFNSKSDKINDDNPGILDLLKLLKTFLPENVGVTYAQTNAVSNPAVQGRPGFANFWIFPGTKADYGPSRLYQLGLSMYPGKRVPLLQNIQDNYSETDNLTLSSTISPLFPSNVKMNLQFKTNWGFQNSATFNSDENGLLQEATSKSSNTVKAYSIFFPGNIDKFSFDYSSDLNANTQNIASAFKSQMSAIPFPNWSMTISGAEKLPFFSEFATSVTLENNYTSEYSEAFSLDFQGNNIPQRMQVTQSFSPLIGINVTFKETFGGNLTASLRINNSKTNVLTPSSSLIQVTNTSDWSLTANYAKSGFEIPFFGLSLKNDITFSLTISKNTTNPTDYKYTTGPQPDVAPGNGSLVTTVNPSIQYSLSSKVQMQLFFKYISTDPTQSSASIPPRTSKEGGLNIRILIQ
jgi:cell surface protein SprA